MKKINQKFIIVLAAVCLLVSCGEKKKEAKSGKGKAIEEPKTLFAVDTMKVKRGDINDYIKLTGDVQAKRNVQVFPDQSGKISSIEVKLGQNVTKGQKLMEINPSKPGMVYALSPVFSPISGVITSLPYKIGETISVQSPVAKVGNLDNLEIVAYVAEKYISKMRMNLGVAITIDAYPNVIVKGYVYEISPIVDEVSRMLEVKINPDDTTASLLKHGMHANIKIFTEKKHAQVIIPSSCITTRYGEQFVFVIHDVPSETTNVEIEKLLSVCSEEERALVLRYFPRILPQQFRGDIFETRILKSLEKRDVDRAILSALYQKDEDNNAYRLKEQSSFDSDCEHAWKLFLELGQKYVLPMAEGFHSSVSEDAQLCSILIDKGIIEKTTRFVEKRVIVPGIQIDNKAEIVRGLLPDEEIVYNGQSLLENNAMVKIVQTLNITY